MMKLGRLLFIILMSIGFSEVAAATDCTQVTEIPKIECEALIAFYDSTGGSDWIENAGWNTNNTPCSWYGIGCVDDYVDSIDLSDNQLSGTIPIELGNLSKLQYLGLSNNQLSGPIPLELGNLKKLYNLYLDSNQFSGPIPPKLGNLRKLQGLDLSNNQLSGLIPSKLGNLRKLQYLGLSNNQLSGLLPSELGNLSYVLFLYLNDNQLCGDIPLSLMNLSNLWEMQLENNALNVDNLDPALKAFLDSHSTWQPQKPAPAVCPTLLATLAYFESMPVSTGISLKWQTLVEVDNASFVIWRGQPNGSQCTPNPADYHEIVQVSSEVSKGNGFSGTIYFYQDNTVKPETTYCYLLEDLDFKANSTFHWDSIASVTTH